MYFLVSLEVTVLQINHRFSALNFERQRFSAIELFFRM